MKIDIHRHSPDRGEADQMVRNLFHNQTEEIIAGNYYSLGLHPWHVDEVTLPDDLQQIEINASAEEVLAIGEAGLDKSIKTPLSIQKDAFIHQIKLSEQLQKPLIIHCVRAYEEIYNLHRQLNPKMPWIIHWFNSSHEMAAQLIMQNFYLSFGHMLFTETSKAFRAFPEIDIQHILLETDDANYSITEIYKKAALMRDITLKDLESQIEKNFRNCFNKAL